MTNLSGKNLKQILAEKRLDTKALTKIAEVQEANDNLAQTMSILWGILLNASVKLSNDSTMLDRLLQDGDYSEFEKQAKNISKTVAALTKLDLESFAGKFKIKESTTEVTEESIAKELWIKVEALQK